MQEAMHGRTKERTTELAELLFSADTVIVGAEAGFSKGAPVLYQSQAR